MATRGADLRERGRTGSSDTLRIRLCHEILHLGVWQEASAEFCLPLGFTVPSAHSSRFSYPQREATMRWVVIRA